MLCEVIKPESMITINSCDVLTNQDPKGIPLPEKKKENLYIFKLIYSFQS
jgi:hypothetical protein